MEIISNVMKRTSREFIFGVMAASFATYGVTNGTAQADAGLTLATVAILAGIFKVGIVTKGIYNDFQKSRKRNKNAKQLTQPLGAAKDFQSSHTVMHAFKIFENQCLSTTSTTSPGQKLPDFCSHKLFQCYHPDYKAQDSVTCEASDEDGVLDKLYNKLFKYVMPKKAAEISDQEKYLTALDFVEKIADFLTPGDQSAWSVFNKCPILYDNVCRIFTRFRGKGAFLCENSDIQKEMVHFCYGANILDGIQLYSIPNGTITVEKIKQEEVKKSPHSSNTTNQEESVTNEYPYEIEDYFNKNSYKRDKIVVSAANGQNKDIILSSCSVQTNKFGIAEKLFKPEFLKIFKKENFGESELYKKCHKVIKNADEFFQLDSDDRMFIKAKAKYLLKNDTWGKWAVNKGKAAWDRLKGAFGYHTDYYPY